MTEKVSVPCVCYCGFSTMDAKAAVEHECCYSCVYFMQGCLIAGDLVHWCKAYAEADPHDRLAKLNKRGN